MAKRILCVLGKLKAGGVESIMYSYYRFLDKEKFQYDFVYEESSDFSVPSEILSLGAKAFMVPDVSNPFKYIAALCRIIRAGNYSIVHSNVNTLSVFSLFAALVCGVKYRVLHNHTTSSPVEKKRTLLKKLLRPFNVLIANKYCACSELAAVWMYGKRAVNKGKTYVFRNGVDTEKFKYNEDSRREIRKELGIENNLVIGHVGRFVTVKNHLFIIDFFEGYLKEDPNARLVLVGEGELLSVVKNEVSLRGLSEFVIFTGVRQDVEKLFSAFDAFVLPSLYEGLPVVVMEACASGLPVILSDKITRECAVNDRVSFISINDAQPWAEELKALRECDRAALGKTMSEGAYNISNCIKELEKFYEECK